MNKRILCGLLSMASCVSADPIITLFLREYPADTESAQSMVNKMSKPGKIARYRAHDITHQPLVAGIFSTYAGYLEVSSYNGQLTFPRRHDKPLIYLAITPRITPMIMFANTIHHWEFEPSAPAALFICERKKDEKTALYFWDMKNIPLPDNNIIPLESLVIIAKPQNFYVPTGITLTHETPNLLLPDIYVKKGINKLTHSLYVLNLTHFFSPEQFMYKKEPTRYLFQPEP